MGRICLTKMIEKIAKLSVLNSIPALGTADMASLENESLSYRPLDLLLKRDPVTAPFTLLLAKNGDEEWAW